VATSIVLDTDVASLILRDRVPPTIATKLIGRPPIITFVTLGELTTWVELRHWGTRRRETFVAWLDNVGIIHSDDAIARTWGRLTAGAVQRGRPRPANDTWIAACCLALNLSLATLNVKDFEDFVHYEGLTLLTS
jgi:predicted nucleic acid-binding protein